MIEMLPYNWEWKGVSRIYKNITKSMGDIHHFAWRAKHPKWAVYPSDHEARYAEWTAEECAGRYGGPCPTMSVSLRVSQDGTMQCNLSSEQMRCHRVQNGGLSTARSMTSGSKALPCVAVTVWRCMRAQR